MNKKIKKTIVDIGKIIAILLMFSPLIIITMNNKLNDLDFWFLLISSIFYDFFLYSVILQNNYIEENKKLFFNVFNGKALCSKTIEEKQRWYEVICIDMFMNYFNDNKK